MVRYYYAVRSGRTPGIYDSWPQCEAQVKGVKGARYAKFGSMSEAQRFIDNEGALKADIEVIGSGTIAEETSRTKGDLRKNRLTTSSTQIKGLGGIKRKVIDLENRIDRSYFLEKKSRTNNSHVRCTTNMYETEFPRQNPQTIIYTDGACSNNGQSTAIAGYGVHILNHPHLNRSGRLSSDPTNQRAELTAIDVALLTAKEAKLPGPLEIRTDSKYCISGLTDWFYRWESLGFEVNIKNLDLFKGIVSKARDFSFPIYLKHVKGHSGEPGNEEADKLAVASLSS